MRQYQQRLQIGTQGPGLYEFTAQLGEVVEASRINDGVATIFCRHTSASLIIQENADPDVKTDLMSFFRRLVPEGMDFIIHDMEGSDDMPAHIRSALTQTSISIPLSHGVPVLGTWQGIYLFEHRRAPHRRDIVVHILGD